MSDISKLSAEDGFRNFLVTENERNRRNHRLYERAFKLALQNAQAEILIAHHLTFMLPGEDPNEVPSADTFMFDHQFMALIFKEQAIFAMSQLAARPYLERDELFKLMLDHIEGAHSDKTVASEIDLPAAQPASGG